MTAPETARSRIAGLRDPLVLVGAAAVAVTVVALVDPSEPGHYPTCPFLALTGLYCPGCGSLRAVHALAHGHLVTAAGFNALSLATLAILALMWLRWARRSWKGTGRTRPAPAAWLWAFLVVVVAFGLVRNLPFGASLAP